MGYLNKAVDSVRKQENRTLVAQGDTTLSGSKYLWLYGAREPAVQTRASLRRVAR